MNRRNDHPASPAPLRPAARRASSMPRSAIREIMAMAAGRPDVIHLEVGEPDFGTPGDITERAFEAVRAGATRYTPNAGMPRLRELVAGRVAARTGAAVTAAEIVITTGAIGALFTALNVVVDAGDEVLVPDPGWPNYESILHLAGATPLRYTMRPDNAFLPDLDEVERLIGPRTKAILLNSPGNPSGAVFPQAVMERFGTIARRHGVYLISDEIYEDIVFEGEPVSALSVAPADRVLLISGVSKSYAMTGWRLGWMVAPAQLAALGAGLQEPVTSCPAAPSQAAAMAALAGPQDEVFRFRDIFKRRRDIVEEVFRGTGLLPFVPRGAFYALIDIGRSGRDSLSFAKDLLIRDNVATVPGITFGPSCENFVRVAFTTEDRKLRTGLERLRDRLLASDG
ncbi:aminotransferase class I/II-fold pyridoxal phosphate-dependent enzyme [Bosea sp. (in: a-proteobacteria)]|uniref:pyridoxal phosphate-dependent aminotransferase n=1 Tax=Bosea sp. (in: a-proteobacteria) TaxID=1871050 RepID=UPI00261A2742|nr:aminotransferase class I/II-fold pyridoxal phosphate-dependent enzyme [Bosea sp. (in: a-proteobacteria)]MCO5092148.1 aminotransferase class I/II-fold pyridoxal phosphate-dependent enzyme [Bosea sp. (in: a-proteobacteria)]